MSMCMFCGGSCRGIGDILTIIALFSPPLAALLFIGFRDHIPEIIKKLKRR